jgi:aminodeoxyfutalosine synthase
MANETVDDVVTYASTLHIQPTNLCELSCPFCSFYAKPGWDTAWFHTPEEAAKMVAETQGLNEIHITGGLWRDCDLDYYKDLFTRIKAIDPNLHIKALTAVEYDFLARQHNLSVEEVFGRMMEWGLGSLPGGGAEILVEEIRRKVAPQKISSDRYLEVHKAAHRVGLTSNITMLFGHIEDPKDIIAHLCRVRDVQDETGGFRTFVPLRYHPDNNALGKRKNRIKRPPDLRLVYAVSRLMLDNVPGLKVLWKYVGIEKGLELLRCGANDFSSTYEGERIIEMAGSLQDTMTQERMESLIRSIGRVPRRVHS